MAHKRVIAAVPAGLVSFFLAVAPVWACGCQKQYMIEKYGSIKGLNGATPTVTTPAAPTTPATTPVQASEPDKG